MKINTINNAQTPNTIAFQGADEFKQARKIAKAAFKAAKAQIKESNLINSSEIDAALKEAEDKFQLAKDANPKATSKVKETKLDKFMERMTTKYANSKFFEKMSKMGGGGANALAYALVFGNTAKELVGTIIYTVQALTNEDLAPDKRKFVGMYDLAVGLISTTISFVVGALMVKNQKKLINALVGKKALSSPSYAKAFAGLSFILPVALQTIVGKRIIAPALATPIAGQLKTKLENNTQQKKGQQAPINPLPPEALVLAKAGK